jgi:hypothetical protein
MPKRALRAHDEHVDDVRHPFTRNSDGIGPGFTAKIEPRVMTRRPLSGETLAFQPDRVGRRVTREDVDLPRRLHPSRRCPVRRHPRGSSSSTARVAWASQPGFHSGRNASGTVTKSCAANSGCGSTIAVTFRHPASALVPEPDMSYRVVVTPVGSTGTVPAGARRVVAITKDAGVMAGTSNGFTINLESALTAPTSGATSVTCAALDYIPGRENVRWVSLDMSDSYRSFARNFFPNARLVADKFHVLRLLTPAIHRALRAQKLRKEALPMYPACPSSKPFARPSCAGARRCWPTSFAASPTPAPGGFNGKAKLVIRRAYGYKSFRNYRLRLLSCCA